MLSDIEIAQKANIKPIIKIAKSIGIKERYLEPYGRYKAKISLDIFNNQFYDSFLLAFKGIPFNATAAIILIAVLSLVIIERLISRKRSAQGLVML